MNAAIEEYARYLADAKPPFDMGEANQAQGKFYSGRLQLIFKAAKDVRAILTDEQWDQLPLEFLNWMPQSVGGFLPG